MTGKSIEMGRKITRKSFTVRTLCVVLALVFIGAVSLRSVVTVHRIVIAGEIGDSSLAHSSWMPLTTARRRETTTTATKFPNDQVIAPAVVPVFVWPNVNQSNFDDNSLGYSTWWQEFKHFTLEGIDRSQYLRRIYDPSYTHPDLIWIVDTNQGKRPSKWCGALERAVQDAQASSSQGRSTTWPIYIMDWSDDPDLPWKYQHCDSLYDMLGRHNVHYLKRSYVSGRHWNTTSQSIELGQINPAWTRNYSYWSSMPVRHVNYGVRSDLVHAIDNILRETYPARASESESDVWSSLPRPKDVVHFWPAPSKHNSTVAVSRKGVLGDNNSQLRDAVSESLLTLSQTYQNITAVAGLTGTAANEGRLQVQYEYARALLEYKIVVVAQKDHWEDHYRLMEALCSGALVFMDRMLMIPEGLEDGKNVVVYDGVKDLVDKIKHYLWHVSKKKRDSISSEGRRVAMTRHRSWHMMERVFHGRTLTTEFAIKV